MSHTSREPSTKFYGPNYRFEPAQAPNHFLVRVYNLQPGEFWNPAWEHELHEQFILLPKPGLPYRWQWVGDHFWCNWWYNPNDLFMTVRCLFDLSYAFIFFLNFCETTWCMNEILVPAGYYAFGGSAEIIFRRS